MTNILVTGSNGFIGKNLISQLQQDIGVNVLGFDLDNNYTELDAWLTEADCIVHLAGINRPKNVDEFQSGNVDLTAWICNRLLELKRPLPFILSSSTQATLDNPYGRSKYAAEQVVTNYAAQNGASVLIYRLTNVFGKWCRPNYNSVVATFCHNIARDIPITISDPNRELDLIHIDDVVRAFIQDTKTAAPSGVFYRAVQPEHKITLGQLADLLHSYRQIRQDLFIPNFTDKFAHKLYSTYLSYLKTDDFAYTLTKRCDPRGCLAEFVKSPAFGQVFVSRTNPGITRGDHYHHLKTEKFLVLEGKAVVRFRHIDNQSVIEYPVRGEDFQVVDIPPGYTHSIENTGTGELITLFWASELFNPERPDTYAQPVLT